MSCHGIKAASSDGQLQGLSKFPDSFPPVFSDSLLYNDRMQNILETTCGAKHTPHKKNLCEIKNLFAIREGKQLNFFKKILLLILAIFDIIFMNCIFSNARYIYVNFRTKHVLSIV